MKDYRARLFTPTVRPHVFVLLSCWIFMMHRCFFKHLVVTNCHGTGLYLGKVECALQYWEAVILALNSSISKKLICSLILVKKGRIFVGWLTDGGMERCLYILKSIISISGPKLPLNTVKLGKENLLLINFSISEACPLRWVISDITDKHQ